MPQPINVPGVGVVNFPDEMSDDAIAAAIKNSQAPTAAGLAKAGGIGLAKGAVETVGIPGDIEKAIRGRLPPPSMEANAAGKVPEIPQQMFPGSPEIQSAIEGHTGKFYEPQNRAERYAEAATKPIPTALVSGGGFGPAALALKALKFGALPGVASEFAREKSEGTPYEKYAPIAAALAAPFAPGVGRKMVTPFAATSRQTEMVERLADRGVTSLTAGERTGSETLQALEAKLGNTIGTGFKADKIADQGERQFTKAMMSDLGESGMATKPELQTARDRIGGEFTRLSQSNNLTADPQLTLDILGTVRRYDKVVDTLQKPVFDSLVNDIVGHAVKGGMTGQEYQILRSQLGAKARSTTDVETAKAFKGLQSALDDAMERGLSDADKIAWRKARSEYGMLKDIEGAVPKEGKRMVEGLIEPAALNRSISSGKDASAAARGELPFSDLAEAGAGVMVRPGRPALQNPTLGGYVAGLPNAAIGNLLMSKLGQGYTGNQIITGARAGSPSIAAIVNALREAQR